MKRIFAGLLLLVCTTFFTSAYADPTRSILIKRNPNSDRFENRDEFTKYIKQKVEYHVELDRELAANILVYRIEDIDFSAMSFDEEQSHNDKVKKIITTLDEDYNILYAEPDVVLHMMREPTDEKYKEQWHYFENVGGINLPAAWDITVGNPEIVAAVVDTGIVKHNEYLSSVVPGRNFMPGEDKNDYYDKGIYIPSYGYRIYHGSHVAGTIAAKADNGGVVGVSWMTRILPVKVLGGDNGSGTLAGIIEGMFWSAGLAEDKPEKVANVLNLSLGGEGSCSMAMQDAINQIVAKNISIVVAAGNGDQFGNPQPAKNFTPANCNNVITVAATNRAGQKAAYSNYGVGVIDIAAPGGETRYKDDPNGILSSHDVNGYYFMQGTSMAAPHVTGVVSLMLAVDENLSPKQVVNYLKKGARGNIFGSGIVDAYKTLKLIQDGDEGEPEPGGGEIELERNSVIKNINVVDNDPDYFYIDITESPYYLTIANYGSLSAPLMKIAHERKPNEVDKDCQATMGFTYRQCIIFNPQPGRYYIKLEALEDDVYKAYNNLSLWGTYN